MFSVMLLSHCCLYVNSDLYILNGLLVFFTLTSALFALLSVTVHVFRGKWDVVL